MRFSCGFLFLLILALLLKPVAHSENKPRLTRAQSVINAFQIMCTLDPLNFDQLSKKATAMRMVPQDNRVVPTAQNTITRSKSWVGFLTSGPFIFLLDEMSGKKGISTSCAVIADVPDVDAFRVEARKTLPLKGAPSPEISNDGSRSYIWNKPRGQGTTLIIRDFKPAGKHGVMMKLLVKR